MNVTVFPEAARWLFTKREPSHCCAWSFGRHRPPVELGHDLLFRDHATGGGRVVARSIVRAIYEPGELDVPMFDGSRTLTGWKVLWYQGDFEDLRRAGLPEAFGKPLTDAMGRVLHDHDEEGKLYAASALQTNTVDALMMRGLVKCTPALLGGGTRLTLEGWRAVRREISPQRQADLEHAGGFDGLPVCRICGCTENHGCDGGCWWAAPNLCSTCKPIVDRCLAHRQPATAGDQP